MKDIRSAICAAGLILSGGPALAQSSPAFTDPASIDRVVERFTGAAIGSPGGARQPTDERLRLAPCVAPLYAEWHGTPGRTVAVHCPDPGGWRIFVGLLQEKGPVAARPIVEQGDLVTVAVRGRGFAVQHQGEAQEAGAEGDWITILTSRSADPVRARIERPGFAVIPIL